MLMRPEDSALLIHMAQVLARRPIRMVWNPQGHQASEAAQRTGLLSSVERMRNADPFKVLIIAVASDCYGCRSHNQPEQRTVRRGDKGLEGRIVRAAQ
ncbi:hypothetical protein D3C72_1875420 [compost metagenome]